MYIRYRPWAVDGLDTHTTQVGLRQLVFEDANQGVLDVRHQTDLEWLLRHPSQQYALAYERYGVEFDAQGQEVQRPPDIPCVPPGTPSRSTPGRTGRVKRTVQRLGRPRTR